MFGPPNLGLGGTKTVFFLSSYKEFWFILHWRSGDQNQFLGLGYRPRVQKSKNNSNINQRYHHGWASLEWRPKFYAADNLCNARCLRHHRQQCDIAASVVHILHCSWAMELGCTVRSLNVRRHHDARQQQLQCRTCFICRITATLQHIHQRVYIKVYIQVYTYIQTPESIYIKVYNTAM